MDSYKYVGGVYSWLDNVLNPFWFWCAEQIPTHVAPNLITLVGTLFLASIGLGVLVFDPTLQGLAPKPVYVWFAICIWVYQTLGLFSHSFVAA